MFSKRKYKRGIFMKQKTKRVSLIFLAVALVLILAGSFFGKHVQHVFLQCESQ